MTSADIMADLRLADRGLRRYATNMTGGPVDGLLQTAYVSTIHGQEPVWDGSRASLSLFRRVHTAVVDVATVDVSSEAEAVGAALRSVPAPQRGALLLTTLEALRPDEASQVLGVSEAAVVDGAGTGAWLLKRQIPQLENADLSQIGRTLAELPVVQAPVRFWEGVERRLGSVEPEEPKADETIIVEPTLSRSTPPPPEESVWPAIWAGVGALAVVALIIVFLVSRSGGEVRAGDGSSTSRPLTSAPPSSELPATTSSLPPPTITPSPLPPTTPQPTKPPTTRPPQPTQPAPPHPWFDRGELRLKNGFAIVEGTVEPGRANVWQVAIPPGATLSISSSALGGTHVVLTRPDNSNVPAEFADPGLIVFTEPGRHALRFANDGGSTATYSAGVGVTGPQSGFLTNLDERGTAASALELVACEVSPDRLTATLTTGHGTKVLVRSTTWGEPSTISWRGNDEADASIDSAFYVTTGLVFTGTIVGGSEGKIGLPAWLGLYGCRPS